MLSNNGTLQNVWFSKGMHAVSGNLWGFTQNVRHYFSLKKRNDALAEENHQLRLRVAEMENMLKIEASSVTVPPDGIAGDFRYIPATIVKISNNTRHNYMIIGKGSDDGVSKGSGVVTGKGAVGIIDAVSRNYSYARSFKNHEMNISARLGKDELIQLIDHVFGKLGIRVAVKLNNRKILAGIAEVIGEPDKIIDITVAIDKLDKIGLDGVIAELKQKGIGDEAVEKLLPILQAQGNNSEKLGTIGEVLAGNATGEKGVEETRFILETVDKLGINSSLELDLTLARGLNYYTGAILEVKALDVAIGSISGGGRYDNLTGVFGLEGVSGVGISFGADRIYDVMNQLDLYPKDSILNTKVMFVNFGEKEALYSLDLVARLRAADISAELYPSSDKMKKQMGYANNHNIPYVAIIGETEMSSGTIAVKNMTSGEQNIMSIDELIALLK